MLNFTSVLRDWVRSIRFRYGFASAQTDVDDQQRLVAEMYDVVTIADEILRIAKKNGVSLTPLQLMKLAYIAFGWHLALRGSKLFSEEIEAWRYGPVIPKLYALTKNYGRSGIPLDLVDPGPSDVDEETILFLNDVFEKYGHLDGVQLSAMTHRPNSPWHAVYSGDYSNNEIPADLIRRYYEEELSASRSSASSSADYTQ